MNEQEFLEELGNVLQSEEPVVPDLQLAEQAGWDSLAWMMILALAERENFNHVKMDQLRSPGSASDLFRLLAGNK